MVQTYLIKRENGRWYAKYRKPDGKWTHHSLHTPNKATAQVRHAQFLKHLEERELVFSSIRPLRLAEFAEEYLRHVKSHKSLSWHSKQADYLRSTILPYLGADTLTTQITSRKIEQYAEWRRGKVKGTTVNKELACIRHMMKKAEEWGNLSASPARRVKDLPDDSQILERYLTPQEYEAVLSQAALDRPRPWTLPTERFEDLPEFIMLDCNTGLRVAEALTLEFTDVDWGRGILRIRNKPHLSFHVKNYQERHIPLNSHARMGLQSMLAKKHPKSEFVFHKKGGSRWATIHDSFNALIKRCGLGAARPFNITLHTMRHTFGSWLAIEGVSLRTIQKLMGHKSITTTERYAHLSGENLSTAVRRLEAVLPKSSPSGPEGVGHEPEQAIVTV
jgi:site-specific recombinase XerD